MASRAVLTRWATDVCGTSVGKSLPLEKQCANGVIYCKLLDSVRPGSINLTRVNNDADGVRTAGSQTLRDRTRLPASFREPISCSISAILCYVRRKRKHCQTSSC